MDSSVHSTRCWSRILANGFWCHYYVPVCAKRMRRKGCQRKWKEIIVPKTAHTSRTTKSNTQTIWIYERSNTSACLGKLRIMCRPGTPIQNHQRVANGRTRTSTSLSISESTASPTTRPTSTNSTCKELQNKLKNLWLRKKY